MFCTLQQFFNDFLPKNNMVPSEATFAKGPMRLKREIRELKSVQDIILGNDVPVYQDSTRYELDEYVSYKSKIYRSLVDGNSGMKPDTSSAYWAEVNIVSLRDLLKRIEALEAKNH